MNIKLSKIEKDGTYIGQSDISVNGEYVGTLGVDYAYIGGRLRICAYSVSIWKEHTKINQMAQKSFWIDGRWETKSRGAWGSDYHIVDDEYKTGRAARSAAVSYIAETIKSNQ